MFLTDLKEQLFDVSIYTNFSLVEFFKLDYLLERIPGPDFNFGVHVIILSIIIALIGIYLGVIKTRQKSVVVPAKKFYSKIANLLYILSAYGLLYVFFRKQSVALFSSRIVLVFWFVLMLALVIYFLYYKYKKLPIDIEKYWAFQTRQKYIPKKKSR